LPQTTVRAASLLPIGESLICSNPGAHLKGSLIARIVFQPLEETARLYFSRTVSQSAPTSKETAAFCSPETQRSSQLLTTLLRLSVYLSILFPAFGPPFISTLLPRLVPWSAARLSTPIQILKAYMLYLPLLSANGMLEAFFASTADRTDLQRQSSAMVLFSGAFLFTAGVCAKGFDKAEEGLVWANCVNMLCRIAFVWLYARRWMRKRNAGLSLSQILPGWPPVVAAVFAAWALRLSEGWASESGWSGLVLHVSLGAILGLGSLGLM
jgi:oligosaccharide translocation protein RFT1